MSAHFEPANIAVVKECYVDAITKEEDVKNLKRFNI